MKPQNISSLGPLELTEGKAKLVLPSTELAKKGAVFYNPKMALNRDFAILFVSSHFAIARRLRVCDPMTGSGVRAVRYVLESPNVACVVAADNDPVTVEAARGTVELNGLQGRITVVELDANLLLLSHLQERFDLIDLDPFGSPAPFFESAARATIDGGVIAATATDMGPLTGAKPAACIRKYGARPVRTEFEKELAVRILAGCLAQAAARLELGIEIVFSYAFDHYARIYASIRKGRPFANQSVKRLGFVEYCPTCLRRGSVDSLESIVSTCRECGSRTLLGGPIWLGALSDTHTVSPMIERTPTLESQHLSELQTILARLEEECQAPAFHYRTDRISQTVKVKPPRTESLIHALREAGYQATRTHFHPNGFRTDADIMAIAAVTRSLSEKA